MEAIKDTENHIVYLVDDKQIQSGRIRDTYSNYGIQCYAYEAGDYAFDNGDCSCLTDAIAAYEKKYGVQPGIWHGSDIGTDGFEIQADGPKKVIIENENGERQTEMETFFNAWAAENVNYTEGRFLTYWNGHNFVSIIFECPGIDNPVWEELSDEETNKYIDFYNRAQFPSEWDHGFKECSINGYKITISQWENNFAIAQIEKI